MNNGVYKVRHLSPSSAPVSPHPFNGSIFPYALLTHSLACSYRREQTGFATTQEAYESNIYPLFESLDRLEKMLGDGRQYIANTDELSEADVRLYTTIVS